MSLDESVTLVPVHIACPGAGKDRNGQRADAKTDRTGRRSIVSDILGSYSRAVGADDALCGASLTVTLAEAMAAERKRALARGTLLEDDFWRVAPGDVCPVCVHLATERYPGGTLEFDPFALTLALVTE